jgi:Holliday junction resolvase RusA-like endonuclease
MTTVMEHLSTDEFNRQFRGGGDAKKHDHQRRGRATNRKVTSESEVLIHPTANVVFDADAGGTGSQRMPATALPTIHFIIPGEPVGKPRMTQRDKWKQRPCVMKYRQWADAAREYAGKIPDGVVRLDWKAVFSPPASWSKKKRAAVMGMPHRSRPDRDNIDKAVLDALFKQDSGIASGFINKVWGDVPRLEVWIEVSPAKGATA